MEIEPRGGDTQAVVNRCSGNGFRTKPIVLEEPELIHDLSDEERAAAVNALVDILADWWAREHREQGAES
ncbi:MAG: hypothetical protein ACRDT4_05335 [Micromonosporaceae bacterium]